MDYGIGSNSGRCLTGWHRLSKAKRWLALKERLETLDLKDEEKEEGNDDGDEENEFEMTSERM